MNKKGEVFILAALIIIVAIFFIVKVYNYVEQPKLDEKFLWLSENYDKEASGVYNSLIYNDEDVFGGFINFTAFFTSYAKSRNPDFGMIYAVNHDNGSGSQIQVGNYLEDDVVVYDGIRFRNVIGCYDEIPAKIDFFGLAINVGIDPIDLYKMREECTLYVPFSSRLWFRVSGYWYPFEVIRNKPQIMIISREEAQEQIQIYTEGIVQEDPGNLENDMKDSCNGLTRVNNIGYYCKDSIGNIIEYCSYYNCVNSCKIICGYYDGKEEGCRELNYCGWNPIGKSGSGECVENCGGVVGPVCGDGNLDLGEECDDGNENNNDGCEGDCKKPAVEGLVCRLDIGCGGDFECRSGPGGSKCSKGQ